MTFTVIDPGIMTTVQDTGRWGYQQYGISPSGCMDTSSAALANLIAGNDPDCALLECMMSGPEINFNDKTSFVITGADFAPLFNGIRIPAYTLIHAKAGDVLRFKGLRNGMFAYIAFSGGIDTVPQLGSRSTHLHSRLGGFDGRQLKRGDVVPVGEPENPSINSKDIKLNIRPYWSSDITLRVIPDRQEGAFTKDGLRTFYAATFLLTSSCDRMGYRLDGPYIEHTGSADIITDGIVFGSVQVPVSGDPIIMMADHQTTGGYTRIANVISCDLPKLAQSAPGTRVKFTSVRVDAAQRELVGTIRQFNEIRSLVNRIVKG